METNNTKNFLTFDVEEWYHSNYDTDLEKYKNTKTNLDYTIGKIIDLCDKYSVKSTCFIVGDIAKNKPYLVKKLHEAGHEIASHSYSHKLVYTMSHSEFKEDLYKSCSQLEDIIGEKVAGFRAPSWSVKKENLEWYYDILDQQGLIYSSSVYPGYTYLYGIPDANINPHFVTTKQNNKILEIPVPVLTFMDKRVGFSGGFYLRFFPSWFTKYFMKKRNKNGIENFIYLHPRELDENQEKLELNRLENFIHYHGLKNCPDKLESLIKEFSSTFTRCDEFRKSFK